MELPRDTGGQLSAWAWPGGYPLYYLDGDNCVLCVKCARESENDELLNFKPVAADVNWEDESLSCDHCGERVESAYGKN